MKNALFILILLTTSMNIEGQISIDYQTPHPNILNLAEASPAPGLSIDKKAEIALMLYRSGYKSIEDLSAPELKLAGLRINPKTNMSSRAVFYEKLSILDLKSSKEVAITGFTPNAKLSRPSWNNKQNQISVLNTVADGVELWLIDVPSKKAKKLLPAVINANIGNSTMWAKDDKSIYVTAMPADKKPLVDRSTSVPTGPTISENDGKLAQNRTYQDLLKNQTDEYNFEQLVRSEIWNVGLDGSKKVWKKADMHETMDLSPDGKFIMINTIKKPFSYIVPYNRFPSTTDVYDLSGKLVKNIANTPLVEDMPKGFMATTAGPRGISWRRDKNSDIYWVEALDGGDPEVKVENRDALYTLKAPFNGEKQLITKTKDRFGGIFFGNDELAVLYETWWNTRTRRTLLINPSKPDEAHTVFNERNYQDVYSDPGTFVGEDNANGSYTLLVDDNALYLMGDGYSDNGKHPFVDKYELATKKTTRIWQSDIKEKLEDISSAIDAKKGLYLTRIEGKSEFPNYYIRDIKSGSLKQITFNKNPYEALNNVHKEIISYKRADGLELNGTLYLPVGYDKTKKEKMPMVMWAYPREFKDKSTASQTTSSPYEFTAPYYGSPLYWLNRGYVVLDDAAFPIVGEGDKEPNDTFLDQLVGNAKAAIDAVDQLGYIDRSKVAVGGHSYGAFMTANLLSHSNLFAAGIARSGAYNRTLTPFGFQSEERNYWEAPEVYNTMSPFMNAHKMKTPLLLIHGEDDNNSGTFPLQSERYFNALKGLGATVRLVMLPKESHGYAAKESIMHMLWEQDTWLEKYVKNKKMVSESKP